MNRIDISKTNTRRLKPSANLAKIGGKDLLAKVIKNTKAEDEIEPLIAKFRGSKRRRAN